MARSRSVAEVITAHRQTEGGGFVVRRPFPGNQLDMADPFLLLDEMGPVARWGPFVMNTEAEIRRAIRDFQEGRLGEIRH